MKEEDFIRFVSDGFDRAKQGRALETYDSVLALMKESPLPAKSHYPFGWIIYYALNQSPDHEITGRKRMLARYLKLNVTKPHKLHSMILTQAIRLYKDARNLAYNKKDGEVPSFSIVKFTGLWQLSNLRPGDWRRKELDGKPIGATVEKLITVCVEEMETRHTLPTAEFLGVVDRAVNEFPDSASLLAQRSALYELEAKPDEARALLRKALIIAPGKFHLWSRLGSLIPMEKNPRLHVALLYRALRAPGQEQFKGRIRLSLAEAWLSRNMPAEAKWELDKVGQLYTANGWHLPKVYVECIKKIAEDGKGEVTPEDPEPFYRRVAPLADEEVFSSLPEIRVVKTYHKNPDANAANGSTGRGYNTRPATAWRVTDETGTNYWLQPHRFGLPADLPLGAPLLIRLHAGRPVHVRLLPQQS